MQVRKVKRNMGQVVARALQFSEGQSSNTFNEATNILILNYQRAYTVPACTLFITPIRQQGRPTTDLRN